VNSTKLKLHFFVVARKLEHSLREDADVGFLITGGGHKTNRDELLVVQSQERCPQREGGTLTIPAGASFVSGRFLARL
jgi:hypothetical protein